MKRRGILKIFSAAAIAAMLAVCTGVYANAAQPETDTAAVEEAAVKLEASILNTDISVNQKFTVAAKASGGDGVYSYIYSYKEKAEASYTEAAKNASGTYDFVFDQSGVYQIQVKSYDSKGTESNSVKLNVTVKKDTGKTLKLSGTVSPAIMSVGSTVSLTANLSGGTEPYQYRYSYKSANGSWIYVDSDKKKLTLPKTAGTYTVRIQAKDYSGKTAEKKFTMNVKSLDISKSTVSKTTAKINEAVKLTAKYSYKSGTIRYRYSYKKASGSSWTYSGNYTTANVYNYKFSSAGTYYVRIQAKDDTGKVFSKQFKVTVKAMSMTAKVSSSMVSTAQTVTLTTKVANSSGKAKYRYSYSSDGNKWKYTGNYTASSSKKFSFAGSGNYFVRVFVKDDSGKTLTRQFKVTVYKNTASKVKKAVLLQKSASWKSGAKVNLPSGAAVNVIEKSGRWFLVKYKNTTGYVYNLAIGNYKNYSSISTATLGAMADDIIYSQGKSMKSLYNYVKNLGYVSMKDLGYENNVV